MRRLATIFLFLILGSIPARAQFNGLNGVYALNHMSFGVMAMPAPAVVAGGSGYTVNDVLVMDCPPDIYVIGVRPTSTVTSVNGSGSVTGISLTTPGFATKLPSTGLAGEANGVCTFNTTGGTGTGATIYAVFGFNAAMGNGSNIPGGTLLAITDGSTTVTNVTQIAFVGATVSGTTPDGIVTVSTSSSPDPCVQSDRVNAPFSTAGATNVQVIAPSAAQKIYICSISLVAGSTAHFSVIEGTGSACTSSNEAAVIGSTTAANGMAIVINGGITYGGGGTVGQTATASNGICILVDASVQFAGNMTYVQQ